MDPSPSWCRNQPSGACSLAWVGVRKGTGRKKPRPNQPWTPTPHGSGRANLNHVRWRKRDALIYLFQKRWLTARSLLSQRRVWIASAKAENLKEPEQDANALLELRWAKTTIHLSSSCGRVKKGLSASFANLEGNLVCGQVGPIWPKASGNLAQFWQRQTPNWSSCD